MKKQICIFVGLLIFSCNFNVKAQNDSIKTIELPTALIQVLRDYETHWSAFNAEALANLFTEDGFILRPGREPVRGREKIAEAYKDSGGPLYLSAYAYEMKEDIAYIIGGYRATEEGSDGGKFTLTLKNINEEWKIFSDMDNGNSR